MTDMELAALAVALLIMFGVGFLAGFGCKVGVQGRRENE